MTRRTLALVTLAAFVVRAAFALDRTGPVVLADEAGYLGNARLLSGGVELAMGASPFYRSGYSLLLAPLLALDLDPTLTYRAVLVLNAALAASMIPLVHLLLTRAFDVDRRTSAWAAIAAGAYPSLSAMTQVALAESALFPLLITWLLAVAAIARPARTAVGSAALVAGTASACWLTHGRMIVIVGLTAVLLAGLAARRRIGVAALATGGGVLAIGFLVGRAVDAFVVDRAYDGRRTDQVANALEPLGSVDGVLTTLRNVLGQSWYLLVAGFGLLVVVVLLEAVPAVRRLRRDDIDPAALTTVALVAATAALLVISALWFDAATRPDQLVYGRYVEPVLPPIVAVGVAALSRAGAWRRLVVVVPSVIGTVTAGVVVIRAVTDLSEGASRWNVASLPFVTGAIGPSIVLGAGVVAVVGAAVLLAASRVRPAAVSIALVALFVPTIVFTQVTLVRRAERATYPPTFVLPRELIEAQGGEVGYDLADFDNVAVKVYQWQLPRTRVLLFDGDVEPPSSELFFGGDAWAEEHPELRVRAVWDDPGRDQTLWEVA